MAELLCLAVSFLRVVCRIWSALVRSPLSGIVLLGLSEPHFFEPVIWTVIDLSVMCWGERHTAETVFAFFLFYPYLKDRLIYFILGGCFVG